MHQEERSWFTEAAICSDHKRTMEPRWTGWWEYSRHLAGLHGNSEPTLGDECMDGKPLRRTPREEEEELGGGGGGAVRLQIRRWGSSGIKRAVAMV